MLEEEVIYRKPGVVEIVRRWDPDAPRPKRRRRRKRKPANESPGPGPRAFGAPSCRHGQRRFKTGTDKYRACLAYMRGADLKELGRQFPEANRAKLLGWIRDFKAAGVHRG